MKREQPESLVGWVPAIWPTLILCIFFVIPFAIMAAISFFHRVEGGFYEPGFELANYARFFTFFFSKILGFSLLVSGLAAVICV
ncbi:MAG: ABC transporter permease, partial [Alphaproteobacteria bacterium]|nr:ABC transporter permease [Alphaproteobacteria bacterium]